MRRVTRLMRLAQAGNAAKSLQTVLASAIVKSALAPAASRTAKPVRLRKSVKGKTGTTLGVVLKQLRLAKSLPTSPARPGKAALAIPKGARFLSRTHRTAQGSRSYKVYLPSGQTGKPKGLILMLHGCGQGPDDFAFGTHMNSHGEKHGLAIVYPAQSGQHNAASCWNWFKPANQARGSGEPALLASLTRKLMREHGLGREDVFVAGLSAGGAMAAILVDIYPEVFSAAGIHSGLARGAARDVLSAMSAMRSGGSIHDQSGEEPSAAVRRIIFHGDSDTTVHPSNAETIVAAALGENVTLAKVTKRSVRGLGYARSDFVGTDGAVRIELWMVEGAGHAWSGGRPEGTYTDERGPDASAQMVRFFLDKPA
jgi:poly(hydroxyalkanoate) depolymerase family esterase